MRRWIAAVTLCLLAAELFACGQAREEPTSAPPGTTVTTTQTTTTETTTTTTETKAEETTITTARSTTTVTTKKTTTTSAAKKTKEHTATAPEESYPTRVVDVVLNFDANGGDELPWYWFYFGPPCDFKIGTNIPTKPGAVFTHWNTASDGSGVSYWPGDTMALPMGGPYRLYAQWEEESP